VAATTATSTAVEILFFLLRVGDHRRMADLAHFGGKFGHPAEPLAWSAWTSRFSGGPSLSASRPKRHQQQEPNARNQGPKNLFI